MKTNIYVNLAVKDLSKTNEFFKKLGFEFNPKFSDEKASCMILNDKAYVMLLQEDFFKTFTQNKVTDGFKAPEVLLAIDQKTKKNVDTFVDKALSIGGQKAYDTQDHEFMYSRSFHDLDGHIWELFWMDEASFNEKK